MTLLLAAGCPSDDSGGEPETDTDADPTTTGGDTTTGDTVGVDTTAGSSGSQTGGSGGSGTSEATGGTAGSSGDTGSGSEDTSSTGGSGSGTGGGDGALELEGTWNDNFGGWTYISSERWSRSAILEYDNAQNWMVTQSPSDDAFYPDGFNYVVWLERDDDDSWWTCTVAFDLPTLEDALATENTADDSDPASGGCGGFSWTQMTPRDPLELVGPWDDNFGGQTRIEPDTWGLSSIEEYSNDDNWAVTQNPPDDAWNPDAFSRLVWTEPDETGSWWTCTVAFGLETFEEALSAEDISDDSDPGNGGCGAFSWTRMEPAR